MAWWNPFRSAVAEAAPPEVAETPARAGFEYGVGPSGLSEYSGQLGAPNGTDRRSMLTELYEAFLTCPWAWASVNAIARTTTAGGLVTDWDADDGEGTQETPDKPPAVLALEGLFAYCNPREDVRQLMRGVIADLLVFGDAFIEVVWLAGQPVAMYSLDCPTMSPLADQHGQVTGYVQVTEFGQRATFEPHEVIHISLDSPRSGLFGVSPTQAAMLPITAWLFTAATLKETFRKGNPANIHADLPAGTPPTEMGKWYAQYLQRNVGPRNIGNPILTKGGGQIHELHQSKVSEYLATLDQKRDEIVAAYGCPPAKVGIIESGHLGGGTGESQDRTFMVNTCQPIAALVLEKINFHIVRQGFGITDWHVKFADVDLRDSKIVEEIRDMRIRNGSYTLNRARAEIGEPPAEGGDEVVIIDHVNMLLWRDLPDYSRALIARTGAPAVAAGEKPPNDEPIIPGGSASPTRKAGESWRTTYRARLREALAKIPTSP